LADSRAVRVSVERGSIPYSPEIHPLPELRKNAGTDSSTDAVQMTRVFPISISADPFRGRDEVGNDVDGTNLLRSAVIAAKDHERKF
jgi:hypothetical protein